MLDAGDGIMPERALQLSGAVTSGKSFNATEDIICIVRYLPPPTQRSPSMHRRPDKNIVFDDKDRGLAGAGGRADDDRHKRHRRATQLGPKS
jgi:hypothetical protein